MKPVFIQSWTIPRKYLRSANLPKAMSQISAMKCRDFYPKRLIAQEIMMHLPIVAFPLFLQTHYIRNIVVVLKVSCFSLIFISSGKGTLFGPVFRRMTHIYIYIMWEMRVKRALVVAPWLDTPCSSNGDCSRHQSNTECFHNTCVCRPGYFYSVSLGTCNTGKSHLFWLVDGWGGKGRNEWTKKIGDWITD